MEQRHVVAVFGSSGPGRGSDGYEQAYELGKALGAAGYVVANGGYGGTMAGAAEGAKKAGGETIGVTCELFGRGVANQWIDKEIRTGDLNERLGTLIELGEAYVVLPGSTGTLLELAMGWELMNKEFLAKRPMICLGSYWRGVVDAVAAGGETRGEIFDFVERPGEVVARLKRHFGE